MKRSLVILALAVMACSGPIAGAAPLPEIAVENAAELRGAMGEVGRDDSRVIRIDVERIALSPVDEGSGPCRYSNREADTSLPLVRGDITLIGNGAVLAGADGARLPFCVSPGARLVVKDLTIEEFGTTASRSSAVGVAVVEGRLELEGVVVRGNGYPEHLPSVSTIISNQAGGYLSIMDSTFSDNLSGYPFYGGVIDNGGDLLIRNSAFTGNQSRNNAAAVSLRPSSTADLRNVTLSGNTNGLFLRTGNVVIEHSTIVENGVGLDVDRIGAVVRNSIIARNDVRDCRFSDGAQYLAYEGVNLTGDGTCRLDPDGGLAGADPRLRPIGAIDDGPPGHEPRADSPVLDRADPEFCPLRDAVGRIRDTSADADDRCALGAIERANEPPGFEIDARLTGTWYDPEHDGHYLSVEVLPDDRVAAIWWTYGPEGEPLWLVGSGPVHGGKAWFPVYWTRGMSLPDLDPAERITSTRGTLVLDFQSCHELRLRWIIREPGFDDGEALLQRLTFNEGLEC